MSASCQFRIEWNNLSYSVDERHVTYEPPFNLKIKKDKKKILQPQSGTLLSGTLTALMGPSGAGKTTLLNCLTARIKTGWHGNIIFKSNQVCQSGQKSGKNQDKIDGDAQLKMAFVPQKDHLFDQLTVRESINFAIRFKNINTRMNTDQRHKRVEKTASDLNLTSCLDTKVSKLSGGQCKRLSVAVELVSTPNILVLDEPTSGLDSTNALIIMKVIKRLLADQDETDKIKPAIICSIHQPSFECLKLFDQIYLLSEKGEKIYFDSPTQVPLYLESQGMTVPDHCNPADYLLDLCYRSLASASGIQLASRNKSIKDNDDIGEDNLAFNIKFSSDNDQGRISDQDKSILGDAIYHHRPFDESQFEIATLDNNNDDHQITKSVTDAAKETQSNLRSLNWYSFFILLLYRNWVVLKSSPTPLFIRVAFCFINVFIPLMYNHKLGSHDGCWNSILDNDVSKNKTLIDLIGLTKDDAYDDNSNYVRRMEQVTDNITFFLMMTNFSLYFHALITVSVIPIEVKIIQKEIYNNWYTINSYVISRILFFLPIMVVQCVIFVSVSFYVSSQPTEIDRLSLVIASFILQAWIAEMVGVIIGSFLPGNVIASTILTILYSFPIIVFGGYFVRVASAHVLVSWLMWISQLRHTFEAVIISVYGIGRCSSEDGTAINIKDMTSPTKMMERLFLDYDISYQDANVISPILGIPDDHCVGEVINGTRDYLGIHYHDANENEDTDNEMIDQSSYSYPMSSFGVHDNDLYRCFYWLMFLTLFYILFAVISVRRLIKN